MKPFVKWAGGKRQILDKINDYIDESIVKDTKFTYIEPFLGGGAVFFNRQPKNAIINDLNSDLINAYKVIKSDNYNELIDLLKLYEVSYKASPDDFYYEIRSLDRNENWPDGYSDIQRAARMIFLNKTCYNGLYRVNSKGQFNTPIGRYKNPLICDKKNIEEIHNYLSSSENNIEIMQGSYQYVISKAKDGDVIYIDPPYDYEDDDGFTKYQMNGFTFEDFKDLKNKCDEAIDKGAYVIISNNATTKVINLFQQDSRYVIKYEIDKINTLRTINSKGNNRKSGREVIIWGMPISLPQANDLEKVIKLLMIDEDKLNDKEFLMNEIEVKSTRQVAYYLSALIYLNYLTRDNKFNDDAKKINKNYSLIIRSIYYKLQKDKYISKFYNDFKEYGKSSINANTIKAWLRTQNEDLAESTLRRRASTIKSWVEWMSSVENKII